jgi:glycerol-3-phosphate acyltransferase PlsY
MDPVSGISEDFFHFGGVITQSVISAVGQYGVGTLFAFLIAALVVWSHRANIKRLFNHTESKTYFGKKPATATGDGKKDGV